MSSSNGLLLAVVAGTCAASASLCAKLAMSGEEVTSFCHYTHDIIPLSLVLGLDNPCHVISWVLRVAIFLLTFLLNGLMWTLFTKSMQLCPSSLHATMTNSSSNLIFSGIIGQLLFGEKLSLKWWSGASLIILGLMLVNRGRQTHNLSDKV